MRDQCTKLVPPNQMNMSNKHREPITGASIEHGEENVEAIHTNITQQSLHKNHQHIHEMSTQPDKPQETHNRELLRSIAR